MDVFKFFFSGEFLFAAFLLANVYKSALPEFFLDANILLFGLTFLIALKRLYKHSKITNRIIIPLILYMSLGIVMLLSLTYSPSSIYGKEKILLYYSLTLWCFIGPYFLINNRESLEKFFKGFIFISVLTSLYVLYSYLTSTSQGEFIRIGVDGNNSLGLGRMAALSIILIIMIYIYNNSGISKIKKLISLMGTIVLVLVLFLTASRMALISLIFAILILILVKSFKIEHKKLLINRNAVKVTAYLIPFPFLLILFSDFASTMVTRLMFLINSSGSGSITQRTERYLIAIDMWKGNLFLGGGLGSYAINYIGLDIREYPHNIILEVIAEMGLFGFIVFIALITYPLINNRILNGDFLQISILLMFIYSFLNANSTGDLNDNRMIFTFLAMLSMYPLYKKRSVIEKLDTEIEQSCQIVQKTAQ